MTRTVEQSAMRKVYLRVLPFAVLTYFFCYLASARQSRH
jgi:hypothetical protein